KGPPALRRSHLDALVAALWPARAGTRRAYSQALAQRNALLARLRAGRGSRGSLGAWDLLLLRDGRELRVYGSQGEQRLALLALLLAERAALEDERGAPPVLLLDDVMSELDAERRERLVERIGAAGQCVITTTDLAHVPGAGAAGVVRLRVAPGAVAEDRTPALAA